MRNSTCFAAILAWSLLPQAVEGQPARLAIVSDSDRVTRIADILTAELSAQTNLQLLERDQIARVHREQTLSAGNGDTVALGKVLGADGVLELRFAQDGATEFLTSKLVAVNPGVILTSERYAIPASAFSEWATGYLQHVRAYLPKLSVRQNEAIPLSIVGIRSAISSATAAELEAQLNLLAIERFSKEPRFFVLERSSMQLLAEEKELGRSTSAFWNGRYLLEITIDPKGFTSGMITLRATLTPPQGDSPSRFEVSGQRADLPAVINQLALRTREALNISNSTTDWVPHEEAERFFVEAKWAMRWQKFSVARAACESSWALGRQVSGTAELRMQAYLGELIQEFADLTYFYRLPRNPDYGKLGNCIRALEQFQADFRRFNPGTAAPATNWFDLGARTLAVAGGLLKDYYHDPGSREEHAEQLAQLRNTARQTLKLIEAHPPDQSLTNQQDRVNTLKVTWGRYWLEQPQEGLDEIRAIFQDVPQPGVRFFVANHNFLNWSPRGFVDYAPDWKPKEPPALAAKWHGFVTELCASTNWLTQLEGYYQAFAEARPDKKDVESDRQFVEAARQLFKIALINGAAYGKLGLKADDLNEDIEGLLPKTWYGNPDPPHNAEAKRLFAAFKLNFTAEVEGGWKMVVAAELIKFFESDRQYEFNYFTRFQLKYGIYSQTWFNTVPRGTAAQLLFALEGWNERYTNNVPVSTRRRRTFPTFVANLQRQLTDVTRNSKTSVDPAQDLALLLAADAGDAAAVQTALDRGANLEARNGQGWTALIIAVRATNEPLTRLLLASGADANTRSTSRIGSTVLCFACDAGNFELIQELLRHGADVNGKSANGQTALDIATLRNQTGIVSFLLARGADPNAFGARDTLGGSQSALTLAVLNNNFALAEMMLKQGGNLELTNNRGETVLMQAAGSPRDGPLRFLIRQGAKFEVRNPNGLTPLFAAVANGLAENARILLEAGADPTVSAPDPTQPHGPLVDVASVAEKRLSQEFAALLRSRQKSFAPNSSIPAARSASEPSAATLLNVDRFWEPQYSKPVYEPMNPILSWARMSNYLFRRNRLWVLFWNASKARSIFEIDLGNLTSKSIPLPYEDVNNFVLVSNSIFVGRNGKIARYGLEERTWQELDLPLEGVVGLVLAGERLIACTKNAIFEISPTNYETRLVASRSRFSPENVLDSVKDYFTQGKFFPGPNGRMRFRLVDTIYQEEASGWRVLCPLPRGLFASYADLDGLLCHSVVADRNVYYLLPADQMTFRPLLRTRLNSRRFNPLPPPDPSAVEPSEPQWDYGKQRIAASWPISYEGGNLWTIDGEFQIRARWTGERRIDLRQIVLAPDQSQLVSLLVFEPGFADPLVVPLRFDCSWFQLHTDYLISLLPYDASVGMGSIGLGELRLLRAGEGLVVTGTAVPGFWFVPGSDLTPRLADQRQQKVAASARQEQADRDNWLALTRRFNLSSTNNYAPETLEQMINDELFVSLYLPSIDENQNGLLDWKEMEFFDANRNQKLDPVEAEGVRIAQRLLVAKATEYADTDGDGRLNREELDDLLKNKFGIVQTQYSSGLAARLAAAGPSASGEALARLLEYANRVLLSQQAPGSLPNRGDIWKSTQRITLQRSLSAMLSTNAPLATFYNAAKQFGSTNAPGPAGLPR